MSGSIENWLDGWRNDFGHSQHQEGPPIQDWMSWNFLERPTNEASLWQMDIEQCSTHSMAPSSVAPSIADMDDDDPPDVTVEEAGDWQFTTAEIGHMSTHLETEYPEGALLVVMTDDNLQELEINPGKPHPNIQPQPKTSFEQLVTEVGESFASLIMLHRKCLEVPTYQSLTATPRPSSGVTTAERHAGSHNAQLGYFLQGTTYETDVVVNGVKTEASADTGASFNVISKSLADSLNLVPEPGSERYINIPSGKSIFSPGRVKTTFTFAGEKKDHDISCIILEHAKHALVLGSKFLRLTRTLESHMHRLKKVVSNSTRLGFNLFGDEQEVLAGYLNGFSCMAVPDSGSDIMALSRSHAQACGFRIRRGKRHKQLVQLIDGSTMYTDGIVENMEWQFRSNEKPIRCNFHVIDNLPVDVILSGAMIDEYNIFTEYDDLIIQSDSLDDQFGIYNIRLAEKCRAEIIKLESSFLQDMSSDQAFSPSMIHRENARRDEIRTRIDGLLVHERQHQQELEKNRQAFFGEELRKHRQRAVASGQNRQDDSANALPPQAGPPIAGACQMTSSSPGATGKSGFWKGVRPKRLRLWKSQKA